MAWSKLEDSFYNHRKFSRMAVALGIRRAEARGLMAGLWSWATTQAPDGDLSDHTGREIEAAMDWEGEPSEALTAAICHGLIDETDSGFILHDWMPRAGSFRKATQKQKERKEKQASKRVARQSRDSRTRPEKVSQARREEKRGEEKRREEKTPLSPSKPKPTTISTNLIDAVIANYQTHHPRSRPGDKERKKIRERLKDGYSVADLCKAIDGCHRTPHNTGNNDRNQTYLALELIMRDSSQVTRFIENADRHAPGSDAAIKAGMAPKTRKTTEALQRFLTRRKDNATD